MTWLGENFTIRSVCTANSVTMRPVDNWEFNLWAKLRNRPIFDQCPARWLDSARSHRCWLFDSWSHWLTINYPHTTACTVSCASYKYKIQNTNKQVQVQIQIVTDCLLVIPTPLPVLYPVLQKHKYTNTKYKYKYKQVQIQVLRSLTNY